MEMNMKTLLAAIAATLFAGYAQAQTVIEYPREACAEIVSTDYSTPGEDSSVYLFEMLCKNELGQYTVFVTSWRTTGAFFGFGRATANTTILLEPSNTNNLIKR